MAQANCETCMNYEYDEEWKRENKGWGTCNFDLGNQKLKVF